MADWQRTLDFRDEWQDHDDTSTFFRRYSLLIIQKLVKAGVAHPPPWLTDNCAYLTIMGSEAYAVSSGSSDIDIYGFCIPKKQMIFNHLAGVIPGFGNQGVQFSQWQEHHIQEPGSDRVYDFSVYNIVKYFDLIMSNNPNMIDSLFTPRRCIIHSTAVGEMVRENRKLFLHKGAWHKFKGYAYAQMSKIKNKTNSSNPKRAADVEEHGYDTKFAYHVVRLLAEVEQILVEHDLDLEKNREQLKSIRRGEWTLDRIENYFQQKEVELEKLYLSSTLPHSPDEGKIKKLLMECLEHHYGTIHDAISTDVTVVDMLADLETLMRKYRK